MIEAFLSGLEQALPGSAEQKAEILVGVRSFLEDAEKQGNLPTALERLGAPEQVAERIMNRGERHAHLDAVPLPDGTTVWASSFRPGYERAHPPDFGLYLDERWQPPWAHDHIDWPDFGLPADTAAMVRALSNALERARAGETVELGCLGGHGRTGTAIACLAVIAGLDSDPVEWVRSSYCERAVETNDQVEFVRSLDPHRFL